MLSRDSDGHLQRQSAGKEGDYWMQSHYCDGDDASLINWKVSARSFHEWVLVKSVRAAVVFISILPDCHPKHSKKSLQIIAGLLIQMCRLNLTRFISGEIRLGVAIHGRLCTVRCPESSDGSPP